MPGSKHKKSRIGLTKNLQIKTDGATETPFRVYGDSIGSANAINKTVNPPVATHHDFTTFRWSDFDANSVDIWVRCKRKHGPRNYDDLTITIIIDDGTGNPDETTCVFDDVEYVP
jgi:hypothetical protein